MKELLRNQIKDLNAVISTKENSRYKSLAATASEQAELWLNAATGDEDGRRIALVRTNIEQAELWIAKC